LGLDALRWLGFIDDQNELAPDNANRQRLADFYGPHPKPAWLSATP
jgi:hypothetical protein